MSLQNKIDRESKEDLEKSFGIIRDEYNSNELYTSLIFGVNERGRTVVQLPGGRLLDNETIKYANIKDKDLKDLIVNFFETIKQIDPIKDLLKRYNKDGVLVLGDIYHTSTILTIDEEDDPVDVLAKSYFSYKQNDNNLLFLIRNIFNINNKTHPKKEDIIKDLIVSIDQGIHFEEHNFKKYVQENLDLSKEKEYIKNKISELAQKFIGDFRKSLEDDDEFAFESVYVDIGKAAETPFGLDYWGENKEDYRSLIINLILQTMLKLVGKV